MNRSPTLNGGLAERDPTGRVAQELIDINERIARLGIYLGVSLATEAEVQSVMDGRSTPGSGGTSSWLGDRAGTDKRRRDGWEELRGLLVLRCELMARCLDDHGLAVTRDIAHHVEIQLQREGISSDLDGFGFLRRLAEGDEPVPQARAVTPQEPT